MAHLICRRVLIVSVVACLFGAAVAMGADLPRLRRGMADARQVEAVRAAGKLLTTAASQSAGGRETTAGWPFLPIDDAMRRASDWLEANQNLSGSWGDTYEFVDTCTAVEALGKAGPGSIQRADGAAWLSGQAASNYEYLARKTIALAAVFGYEGIAENLAEELLAVRNPEEWDAALPNWPEGGWGVAEGYETDCLTTALALLALDAAGFSGGFEVVDEPLAADSMNIHEWNIPDDATRVNIYITVTGTTVHFRMAEGEPPMSGMGFSLPPGSYWIAYPDSGLPFTPGHNYIVVQDIASAAGAYTMTATYETPTFDMLTLAEPLAYLREAQNVDGGWGLQLGMDTELYTTMHVLWALQTYHNYDLNDEIDTGISYAQGQQLGDGSFGYGGVPIDYVTSLAVIVLVESEDYPFGLTVNNAMDALQAAQDADGSWVQESYHTATALLALFEYLERCPPAGDCDGDRDTDLVDYSSWPSCAFGPHPRSLLSDCTCLDIDGDADVDLRDFAVMQRRFTGGDP